MTLIISRCQVSHLSLSRHTIATRAWQRSRRPQTPPHQTPSGWPLLFEPERKRFRLLKRSCMWKWRLNVIALEVDWHGFFFFLLPFLALESSAQWRSRGCRASPKLERFAWNAQGRGNHRLRRQVESRRRRLTDSRTCVDDSEADGTRELQGSRWQNVSKKKEIDK